MDDAVQGLDPMCAAGLGNPGTPMGLDHVVPDSAQPVLKPEEITFEVAQPPKYEQVVVAPPQLTYCPAKVAYQEVHQPPVLQKCVQYKKEYVPMRAEFESQPVDPSVLTDNSCPHAPAGYARPIKTSAFDE
ncbi:unnamed protein product [Notodromas monacha]|uniref:Uncharacterized protein n=1 Tax=Notodromas monacha TaxID=399045 RepID=A0A7R9BVG7_9CRUS|nr:unnamed protein product [Notodromas monacha]CAG0921431.1 unnamed protein product [Notodromas monacha]